MLEALCTSFILSAVYDCVSSSERSSVASNWCVRITEYCRKDIKGHQSSGGSRGRVRGVQTPSIRPETCLRLKSLQRLDCISLFNWLNFVMKRVLYFADKLNSRDIQKCDCLWVPSYDLFASARKAVFPTPTATG